MPNAQRAPGESGLPRGLLKIIIVCVASVREMQCWDGLVVEEVSYKMYLRSKIGSVESDIKVCRGLAAETIRTKTPYEHRISFLYEKWSLRAKLSYDWFRLVDLY